MLDRTRFMTTGDEVLQRHGQRLRNVIGQPMTASWVAWDRDRDTWFTDEAVIVQIGAEQIEIVWWELDALALSWNGINRSRPVAWVSDWHAAGMNLAWRQDALPVFQPMIGKILTGIALVEYDVQTTVVATTDPSVVVGTRDHAWVLNGLAFRFGDHYLEVFNALDENGVTDTPSTEPAFRSIAV